MADQKEVVKGNITVTFSYKCLSTSSISIELDDKKNNDKTCFLFGETVYFKVYTIPSDMNLAIFSSAGSVDLSGSQTTETVRGTVQEFIDEITATVNKPIIDGPNNVLWFGNDWGPLVKVDEGSFKASGAENLDDPDNARVNLEHIACCIFNYGTSYRSGSLSNVGENLNDNISDLEVSVIVYVVETTEGGIVNPYV
jgi:hypothetical protein